jgi:hypothetical protein
MNFYALLGLIWNLKKNDGFFDGMTEKMTEKMTE